MRRVPTFGRSGVVLFAVVIAACVNSDSEIVAPPNPLYTIDPDPQLDCGDIYNPCEIEGGIHVVVKRQPGDDVQWPEGRPCTEIPGGCFPPDADPIVGPEPYYSYGGATAPHGDAYEGSQPAGGAHRAYIQMAIRQLSTEYDQDEVCAPLVNELVRRLGGGIWTMESDWANGEWVRAEAGATIKGTIYINVKPGFIWKRDPNNPDDRFAEPDMDQLRTTLIHEAVHMYFDGEVGHLSKYTQEQRDAFYKVLRTCGG